MSCHDERDVRRLDGTLLLVFRELLRHRTTIAAGARLGLSQSGVSHALRRLRDVFGDPLFLRRSHGLEPTRRALELAPRIDALIAMTREAVAGEMRYDPARSTRQFHVGGLENLIPAIAAQLIQSLESEAPNASVVFRFYAPEEALEALERGEIDLAVGPFAEPPPGVMREFLLHDEYALVGRCGHPALAAPLDAATFCELPQVVVSPTGAVSGSLDPLLAERGLRRRVRVVAPRLLTALAISGATEVVLVAPRSVAERYAPAFGLSIAALPAAAIGLDIFTLRRDGPRRDAAVDWLAANLRRAMGAPEAVGGPAAPALHAMRLATA